MKLILHYPEGAEALAEMERRVAEVHADIVISKIQKMNLSADKKKALLNLTAKKAKDNFEVTTETAFC